MGWGHWYRTQSKWVEGPSPLARAWGTVRGSDSESWVPTSETQKARKCMGEPGLSSRGVCRDSQPSCGCGKGLRLPESRQMFVKAYECA